VATQNISITICVGDQFGRRTVIADAGYNRKRGQMWRCRCVCGTEADIEQRRLAQGQSLQCSQCSSRYFSRNIKHGETRGYRESPEYKTWHKMIDRCDPDKSDGDRKWYADKGVKVCERWRSSFSNFLADMGRKPSPKHSIDRINNDGNYEPANCRWATSKQQTRNYSRNRLLTIAGVTMTLTDWAEASNMKIGTLRNRLEFGWSVQDALAVPVAPWRGRK
jgi:hypothetical protein